SRLTIAVPDAPPGVTVSRDGTDVAAAAWGSPIAVDAGAHAIHVVAPGYQDWNTSATVSPGQTLAVEVPHLELAGPKATAATAAPSSETQTVEPIPASPGVDA